MRLDGTEGIFATGMTPHDIGLADLLDAARLSNAWPEELVLHGAQPGSTAIGTELTVPVAAALGPLIDAIEAELTGWRATQRPNGDAVRVRHASGSAGETQRPLSDRGPITVESASLTVELS